MSKSVYMLEDGLTEVAKVPKIQERSNGRAKVIIMLQMSSSRLLA